MNYGKVREIITHLMKFEENQQLIEVHTQMNMYLLNPNPESGNEFEVQACGNDGILYMKTEDRTVWLDCSAIYAIEL